MHKLPDISNEIVKRFCIIVIFSIAFAYIEAVVVVYLREIFYPCGFTFPLAEFGGNALWKRLLLTEVGREAATLVLIFTGSILFGRNRYQRVAYFLTIFAVWDIFYYVWLKVLLGWPASIMDWDILFLMPQVWASSVLAPVLISVVMLVFTVIILYRDHSSKPIKVTLPDKIGFVIAGLIVVVSLCTAGPYIMEADFRSHFYWPLFAAGNVLAIGLFAKCLLKTG